MLLPHPLRHVQIPQRNLHRDRPVDFGVFVLREEAQPAGIRVHVHATDEVSRRVRRNHAELATLRAKMILRVLQQLCPDSLSLELWRDPEKRDVSAIGIGRCILQWHLSGYRKAETDDFVSNSRYRRAVGAKVWIKQHLSDKAGFGNGIN